MSLPVPSDRSLVVVNAPDGTKVPIVYMHGLCGDVYALRSWAASVHQVGTIIGLLGDVPCKRRPGRFRWGRSPKTLHERVQRALHVVKQVRGGQLDLHRTILVGYSQGASRVQRLAHAYPQQYQYVAVGSPPLPPDTHKLVALRAVALFAGALEGNRDRRSSLEDLIEAGMPARLFLLPHASHGSYGPQGAQVMASMLTWLADQQQIIRPL